MIIRELVLQQFRCFNEQRFSFDGRVVIVQGPNGVGKSSLLEALHYCCYLRSFRTHLNRELVMLGKDLFFINVSCEQEQLGVTDQIQVGFSDSQGKVVKYNQKPVQSYRELLAFFKVVTLTADDVLLVQGDPEGRRDFLNYALLLSKPELSQTFKDFYHILQQRNSLLAQRGRLDETFLIWTQKLWEAAQGLREQRVAYLQQLELSVNAMLEQYFVATPDALMRVNFVYTAKYMNPELGFDAFWDEYKSKHGLTEQEWGRSLFGIHLDDFSILFQNKKARMFASRGQQKLLALLIKIAQLQQLSDRGEPGILLLDDFMTDFDHTRVAQAFKALEHLKYQMFISCPISPKAFLHDISTENLCHITL